MHLRPYTDNDLSAVRALYHQSIHQLAAPHYSADQLAAWSPEHQDVARWTSRLAPLITVLADWNGVVAGFASYNPGGHLDLLFTHPLFARRGVATLLCDHIERALSQAGVPRVYTEASLAARPFFEQRAYVVQEEQLVDCRGARLRRFAMDKILAPLATATPTSGNQPR